MSDEEVSGLALLTYIGILAAGYMTVMNVSLISFILGAILIPLAFAIGIVYADGIVSTASDLTDKIGRKIDQKWTEFRESDEEDEVDEIEDRDELIQSYDSTYDAENGEADIISAKVDPEQESVIVIDFMTASGQTHSTEVEIPPSGEWNREYKLPTLCAYMGVAPVWDYDQLSNSDKKIPITESHKTGKTFDIQFKKMRRELPEENLAELAAKSEETNLEIALGS